MWFSRINGLLILTAVFSLALGVRSSFFSEWQIGKQRDTAKFLLQQEQLTFKNVSSELGLTNRYTTPGVDAALAPIDLHVIGGGVAVADVNQDGWFDIFFASGNENKSNHLYLNRNGTQFEDVTTAWGLGLRQDIEDGTTHPLLVKRPAPFAPLSASFFDANSDGSPDLYLAGVGCSRFYLNEGTFFTDRSQESGVSDCRNSQMGVPADFDLDGDIDLYVLRYFGDHPLFNLNETNVWVNSVTNATNGGANTWYLNEGNGKFSDASSKIGAADSHFSLDASALPMLGNGRVQLFVANDFGPDSFYEFDGARFNELKNLVPQPDRRLGMSVSMAYLGSKPFPHLHISNGFHALWRNEGNFLWRYDGVSLSDRALEVGTNNCNWAWGSVFADLNRDGAQDLYIANGFITGESLAEVAPGAFAAPTKDLSFKLGTLLSLPGYITQESTISVFLLNDSEVGRLSFAGGQRDCLFLADGDRYTNVSPAMPEISDWDGRAVARIDFDNDGDLDLVVTTRNRGVQLLQNLLPNSDNWLGIDPSGVRSYWGWLIQVSQGDYTSVQILEGGKSGFLAISDPRLFWGLPDASKPVEVFARDPATGKEVKLGPVKPGHYYRLTDLLAQKSKQDLGYQS
jgi:hypothetical protein